MLSNSIASHSHVAFIMNAKYTNAVPLYRQEQELDLNIFYYISHLLTEIPKHMYDTDLDFLFCFFVKARVVYRLLNLRY